MIGVERQPQQSAVFAGEDNPSLGIKGEGDPRSFIGLGGSNQSYLKPWQRGDFGSRCGEVGTQGLFPLIIILIRYSWRSVPGERPGDNTERVEGMEPEAWHRHDRSQLSRRWLEKSSRPAGESCDFDW